jgi:hypothetical protein
MKEITLGILPGQSSSALEKANIQLALKAISIHLMHLYSARIHITDKYYICTPC